MSGVLVCVAAGGVDAAYVLLVEAEARWASASSAAVHARFSQSRASRAHAFAPRRPSLMPPGYRNAGAG